MYAHLHLFQEEGTTIIEQNNQIHTKLTEYNNIHVKASPTSINGSLKILMHHLNYTDHQE
jgi:hypothetical protein